MKEIKFIEVEAPIKMKSIDQYTTKQEDVWGKVDMHNYKKLSQGMIVARYNDICPIFNDIVPYESVTVVGPLDKQDEIEFWLNYVNGGGSISKVKIIDDNKVAIRSDYVCW